MESQNFMKLSLTCGLVFYLSLTQAHLETPVIEYLNNTSASNESETLLDELWFIVLASTVVGIVGIIVVIIICIIAYKLIRFICKKCKKSLFNTPIQLSSVELVDGWFTPNSLNFSKIELSYINEEQCLSVFIHNTSKTQVILRVQPFKNKKLIVRTIPNEIQIFRGRKEEVKICVTLKCSTEIDDYITFNGEFIRVEEEDESLKIDLHIYIKGRDSYFFDLDNIEQKSRIENGPYSVVFKGLWNNIQVAIKSPIQIAFESFIKDFDREIELAKRIKTICVAEMIGISIVDQRLAIISEFAPYGNLELYVITHSRFNPKLKIMMAIDICRAVGFLHQNGIIHCNIKPSNILIFSESIEDDVRCKLSDFGSVREPLSVANVKLRDMIGETPVYTDPRILSGESADFSSDAYSCGVIIYYIITEQEPFRKFPEETNEQLIEKIIVERNPKFPNVIGSNEEYKTSDIIMKMFEKLPRPPLECSASDMSKILNE